jgi:hypothetical protein
LKCVHQYSYEIASGNSDFPNFGELTNFGMGSQPLEIQFWEWEDFFVPTENHLPRLLTQFFNLEAIRKECYLHLLSDFLAGRILELVQLIKLESHCNTKETLTNVIQM